MLVSLPFVAKRFVAVIPVVEAWVRTDVDAKMFCVKVLRNLRVEDPRENVPVTDGVVLPAITRRSVGVVEPRPRLPLPKRVRSCVPEEEATANGFTPGLPCTLKLKVEDVALIPATVPLSKSDDVARVVAVNHRVAKPVAPPVIDAVIARDDVDTHLVEVPDVWRTIPMVPAELVVSRKAPRRVRLVAEALVIRKLVEEPLVAKKLVAVALVILPLVAKRLVAVRPVEDDWVITDVEA